MITIGFSSHHAEALPYARRQMEKHQIIVLEEAPLPNFLDMLDGRLSIDEYMMALDSGFPGFERLMCVLLRDLHSKGRQIIQVEPYLETLLQIHELLSDGNTPEDVMRAVLAEADEEELMPPEDEDLEVETYDDVLEVLEPPPDTEESPPAATPKRELWSPYDEPPLEDEEEDDEIISTDVEDEEDSEESEALPTVKPPPPPPPPETDETEEERRRRARRLFFGT